MMFNKVSKNRIDKRANRFYTHKLKILLMLFLIIFCYFILSACGIVQRGRICIEDSAGLLNNSQERELVSYLLEYEKRATVQIALKTVDSLGGVSLEEYSIRTANEWGLGNRETNNGALFVLSVKEGALRLELGYGLEWCIIQSASDEIIKQMIPFLKEKEYYKGFKLGFDEVIRYTEGLHWEVEDIDINKVAIDNNSVGRIFSFSAREIKRRDDKVMAVTSGGVEVEIKTTKYMENLVKQMEGAECVIIGRITSIKPVSVELLNAY